MSIIDGKQVRPASTTRAGVLTTAAQTVFGQKTFDSTTSQATAVISCTNLAGTSGYYVVSGSPEGSVSASIGAIAESVTDGTVYSKVSGSGTNTGWVPLAFLSNHIKSGLAAQPNTEGRLFWSTDTDELYSGTGTTKHKVGPSVYNTAARLSRPVIWMGQATAAATTGIWTLNYAAAGFVTAPLVFPAVNNSGTTNITQAFASVTGAPTTTTVSGRVIVGRNATTGQPTMTFPTVGTYVVQVLAIGDGA